MFTIKGDDDVCMCKVNGTSMVVTHNYNPGDYTELMSSANSNVGLTNAKLSITNNTLSCTLTRKNTLVGQANYFSTANSSAYFILFAMGPTDLQSNKQNKKGYTYLIKYYFIILNFFQNQNSN